MNTQRPIEPQQVFIDLALAVAAALECPECPESLRDALNDSIVNELIDLLSADNIALLRALAGQAQLGDGRTRAEAESLNAIRLSAKSGA
jgi:hypothetical protein